MWVFPKSACDMAPFHNSVRIIRMHLPCSYEIAVHASHYPTQTYEYNMTVSMVQLLKNNPRQLKCLKLLPAITARLLLIYPGPQASEVFAPISQCRLFFAMSSQCHTFKLLIAVESNSDKSNRNATSPLEKLGLENRILNLTRIDYYRLF